MCRIFDQDFRKGLTGIIKERRKLELLADVAVEAYEVGDTDWDQHAVVNEDDLVFDDE